jgi:hypothetical protein
LCNAWWLDWQQQLLLLLLSLTHLVVNAAVTAASAAAAVGAASADDTSSRGVAFIYLLGITVLPGCQLSRRHAAVYVIKRLWFA